MWGSVEMLRKYAFLAGLFALVCPLLWAAPSHAQSGLASNGKQTPSAFMKIFGPAKPPYGFVQFCESNPERCITPAHDYSRFAATPERLSELDQVNRYVNETVRPLTDKEIYGVSEYWTFPDTTGDCEDYALLKRDILIRRGWPESALLLTVVRDERGEGHAVLTVRTANGDFVLDNKITKVNLWHQTPYEYVMRQSYVNPKVWVSLERGSAPGPDALAGVRR